MRARRHSFEIGDLSVNEIAYIAGGEQRVTDVAIISLIEREFLSWDEKQHKLTVLKNNTDWTLTENENLILSIINNNGVYISNIYAEIETKYIIDRLKIIGIEKPYPSLFYLAFQSSMLLMYLIGAMRLILEGLLYVLNIFFDFYWAAEDDFDATMAYYLIGPLGFITIICFICIGIHDHLICKRLLKKYRQATPLRDSSASLSLRYALYGDSALPDTLLKLCEYLRPRDND